MDRPVEEILTATGKEDQVIASYAVDSVLGSNDELLDEPLAKGQVLAEVIESELDQDRGVGVYFAQVNRRD